jgi:hypothetical protein
VISASELVGGILQYYLNRGDSDRLYSENYKYMTKDGTYWPWARTKTKISKTFKGYNVGLGHFASGGLRVPDNDHDYDNRDVGVGVVYRNS